MGTTGPEIKVSPCEHVHYEESVTSFDRGHKHEHEFTTQIAPNPPKHEDR